jgi:hypothetical protein
MQMYIIALPCYGVGARCCVHATSSTRNCCNVVMLYPLPAVSVLHLPSRRHGVRWRAAQCPARALWLRRTVRRLWPTHMDSGSGAKPQWQPLLRRRSCACACTDVHHNRACTIQKVHNTMRPHTSLEASERVSSLTSAATLAHDSQRPCAHALTSQGASHQRGQLSRMSARSQLPTCALQTARCT